MKRLVFESWLLLLYIEWIMRFREFRELCTIVRDEPIHPAARRTAVRSEELCRAMDYACVFYFKHVFCLQRSSATNLLLRRHGLRAEMMIGVRNTPFRSHAWVEVEGTVINDKPQVAALYTILERI